MTSTLDAIYYYIIVQEFSMVRKIQKVHMYRYLTQYTVYYRSLPISRLVPVTTAIDCLEERVIRRGTESVVSSI